MIDVSPEQKRRKGGPVDPTGAVTSGQQSGPLRGGGGRPVADPDEAIGEGSRERDLSEKDVGADLRPVDEEE